MDDVELRPGLRATRHFALLLEKERTAVICDVHLGYEGAMLEQGTALPRMQRKIVLERLTALLDAYAPDRLIVDGDFKHDFSKNLQEEWADVSAVLDFLKARRVEATFVRGNHDNFLKTILAAKGYDLVDRLDLGGFTFVHGHEAVKAKGTVVIGHEHPAVKLRDDIGATRNVPCFLLADRLLVLPAFSPLALGNDLFARDYLSPFVQGRDLSAARLWAVDEQLGLVALGRFDALEAHLSARRGP